GGAVCLSNALRVRSGRLGLSVATCEVWLRLANAPSIARAASAMTSTTPSATSIARNQRLRLRGLPTCGMPRSATSLASSALMGNYLWQVQHVVLERGAASRCRKEAGSRSGPGRTLHPGLSPARWARPPPAPHWHSRVVLVHESCAAHPD